MKLVGRRAAILASSLLLSVFAQHGVASAATKPAPAKATVKTGAAPVKTPAAKPGAAPVKTPAAKPAPTPAKPGPGGNAGAGAPAGATAAPAKATVKGTPTLASRLDAVRTAKTINYYPSNAGWSAMWTRFDAARIEADLTKAAALGADDVRVIVFPSTFGYPTPKADYTARLNKLISIADGHGLTVKLTLFDWWEGYTDTAGSAAWARAVLAPYANDPRVLSVEVQNEFDPSDARAVTWVKKIIPSIRAAVPTMPLTLSVSGATGSNGLSQIRATLAATPLDYLDFHFYGNSERSLAEIRTAQAAAAPLPIVIGETGLSTVSGTEGEQAAYLARVFAAARVAGVGSVAPWTLTDFSDGAIPTNSAVSKIPAQYKYGLYRADGSAKAAAAVVKAYWAGQPLTNSVLDLGFEAPAGNSPWRPYLSDAGPAVRVNGVAHSGSGSVKFTGTSHTDDGLPAIRTAPVTPVQPGLRWHAEAWAKGQNLTGTTQIALSWFDANDRWLGQTSSRALPTGTTGWTKLTVDATAPAGAAGVQLHLKSGNNRGTAWFDDVTMS
ncbi:glycosyl hydrolase [Actinoplanes sp. SE50]|uniref:cellulase family glycosylhydrolase n=1 Tax=unclassified Actinoplanes TaxID=2626549 RepID=UPI00023ECF68|nr:MULTISPECIES: cellulase family glycosylhydrolase [unclassified Actinoplanes]AEV87784.1 Endoglucanase [Actinoplanes sp. SE50/110]ATO86186.1 glycosyl hydrolase [Actinoplanes sp. SE50]SLM03600.1 glycosyl hydrolase [Actinoplanes sp. SE50/110]